MASHSFILHGRLECHYATKNRGATVVGAWGIGPFENDSGIDAAYYFVQVVKGAIAEEPSVYLHRVLSLADDYAEADEGAEALAVAALLAGHSDAEADGQQVKVVGRWLEAQPAEAVTRWRALARVAVLRVLADDSELAELWDEGEDAEEWRADTQRLAEALA